MRRQTILLLICVSLLVFGSMGAALAMPAASYQIVTDTARGGGSGGGTAASASYQLVSSLGHAVQVSGTSAGYQACSGFLCRGLEVILKVFLPVIKKNFH